MKRKILFLLLSFILLFAEDPNFSKRMETTFSELSNNETNIYILNAVTGDPVEDVKIEISSVGIFETNFEGKISFQVPEDGKYNIIASKKGYITLKSSIEILFGSIFVNANIFSLSPEIPLEYIRVVLEWGEEPRDLDLHLVKKNKYHISYRHKRVSKDGKVRLDRDDTNGKGPETITIKKIDRNAEYSIYVHNYSQRNVKDLDTFYRSGARLTIYTNNVQQKVIQIPKGVGVFWNVINIENGKIVEINKVSK